MKLGDVRRGVYPVEARPHTHPDVADGLVRHARSSPNLKARSARRSFHRLSLLKRRHSLRLAAARRVQAFRRSNPVIHHHDRHREGNTPEVPLITTGSHRPCRCRLLSNRSNGSACARADVYLRRRGGRGALPRCRAYWHAQRSACGWLAASRRHKRVPPLPVGD